MSKYRMSQILFVKQNPDMTRREMAKSLGLTIDEANYLRRKYGCISKKEKKDGKPNWTPELIKYMTENKHLSLSNLSDTKGISVAAIKKFYKDNNIVRYFGWTDYELNFIEQNRHTMSCAEMSNAIGNSKSVYDIRNRLCRLNRDFKKIPKKQWTNEEREFIVLNIKMGVTYLAKHFGVNRSSIYCQIKKMRNNLHL